MKESSVRDSGEKSEKKLREVVKRVGREKKVEQREYIVSLNFFFLSTSLNFLSSQLFLLLLADATFPNLFRAGK